MRLVVSVVASCLSLAACDATFSTPHRPPQPSPQPSPSPSPTPTPSPSPSPTPSPTPTPTPTPTPSPSCSPGWGCSGDDLTWCDGTTTERYSCDSVCRDLGFDYATGCAFDQQSGDESCWCDDYASAPTCDLAYAVCGGDNSLDSCDAAGPVTYDCDALCQSEGYDYSEGCGYDSGAGEDACFCNTYPSCYADELTCGDGTCLSLDYVCDGIADCPGADDEYGCPATCTVDDNYCIDDYTIATCGYDGQLEAVDCDAVCQDAGYYWSAGCGYDSGYQVETCFCE